MAKSNKTNADPDDDGTPQLLPAPLAYLNPDFLNSPDGRLLRILAEYSEPLSRFRRGERPHDLSRGCHCSPGMIIAADRRTEKCHDLIANELVEGAVAAKDRP